MIYAENILICIAIPLLLSLLFLRGNARTFTASFLLGMVFCLLAGYISGFICFVSGLSENDTSVFISPVIEEAMKFLPLLFYLFIFSPENDGLLMSAVGTGAGFGTFENCCYILTSGADHLGYVLIRGMAVGVMHIVSLLALVCGVILVRRTQALSFSGIVGALSLSMTFHGLYNLLVSEPGLSSAIGYILPLLTGIILYIPIRRLLTGYE